MLLHVGYAIYAVMVIVNEDGTEANLADTVKALAVYGDAARAYFAD